MEIACSAVVIELPNGVFMTMTPAGLRIWAGATVEATDVRALMPWLDWAFAEAVASLEAAA